MRNRTDDVLNWRIDLHLDEGARRAALHETCVSSLRSDRLFVNAGNSAIGADYALFVESQGERIRTCSLGSGRSHCCRAVEINTVSVKALGEEINSQGGLPLERAARNLLSRHSHFHGRADCFQFQEQGEVLVIEGTVPSFYLKQMLQCALLNLRSISRIENRVQVIASDGVSERPEGFQRLDR